MLSLPCHFAAARRWLGLFLLWPWVIVACATQMPVSEPTAAPTDPPAAESDTIPVEGQAIVATNTAILQAEPNATSERLATLRQDDVVILHARTADGDWQEVTLAGHTVGGWISTTSLVFITPTPTSEATTPATQPPTSTTTATPDSTATPTLTATSSPSPTATNSPTPTATRTVAPPTATSTTALPTATPSSTATLTPTVAATPLDFTFTVTWELDPNDSEHAIATVNIFATGGNGDYVYYHDNLAQEGPVFQYRWRVCRANPTSFRVDSTDGQSVTKPWYGEPPCPHTPTPGP